MRKKQTKGISVFLAFLMVISLFVPSISFAQSGIGNIPENANTGKMKIHENVLEEFEEKEFVRFLVLLEEQVDTKKVSLQAVENNIQSNVSAADLKAIQQEAVVNELVKTADETQKSVANLLENMESEGKVKDFRNYYIVNGFAVTGTKEIAEELAADPEVKYITEDAQQTLTPITEDTEIAVADGSQTASSEEVEWNVERVGAPEVWDRGITGEGAVVANLDSGVDYNHPALNTKYRGYNPEDPDNRVNEFNWFDAAGTAGHPLDSDGHGTHTMGTMVGEEGELNRVGVAPGAEWISARAFRGDTGYDSDIIEAAQWLLAPTDENGVPHPEMAPDVINNSWGGNSINNDWFRFMVQSWRAAGIVPVFSIGNSGFFNPGAGPGTASAPGNYPESIGVGATDENDEIASFSLKGPTETGVMKPDIAAPGVNIRSSIPGETWDQFDYTTYNGTSMAAPAVAATAALMLEADESLTVDEIHNVLRLTANAKTNEEYTESPNNAFGYGLLDANAAVEAIEAGLATIHGQISGPGVDEEAPVFEHEPRETVFLNEEAYFSTRAMDDVSVENVSLMIEYDNGDEVTYRTYLSEGDHRNGLYETYLPAEDIFGESLEYWWVIDDFSGKQTVSDRYPVSIEEGVTDGYVENFETYPDGWFSFGMFNTWEWGVPEFGPESAASGEKVMGTNLRGNYNMNSDMTLVSPPVLPEEGTQLRFNQWYSLSWFGWDKGKVYVSRDLQNWEEVYGITEDNENWHEVGIDLSQYAGEKIYIGFNLTSLDNEFPGWYIDDVQLVNNATGETVNENGEQNVALPYTEEERAYPVARALQTDTSDTAVVPVDATVTVLETGWQTQASARNGAFTIHHEPGDYTLEVEAYGYETVTETVTLEQDGEITANIDLDPIPTSELAGVITDYAGNPVSGATILVLEDENMKPIKSSADGSYSLQVYDETYTVKIFAEGYRAVTETISVENEDINLDATLYPYPSNEDSEIYYDNGDWGNNLVFGSEGSGFAVKMSLAEGEEAAMLTGAKLRFWAGHIPVPGGDDIKISVYDATGVDGAPGNKIVGPVDGKAVRDLEQWSEVDLSHLGVVVEDDFYILYQQADDYPYVPGFVTDGDSDNAAGRSWDYFGGEFYHAGEDYGNYMIRSVVDYGVDIPDVEDPVITSPESGGVIDENEITITGTASPSTEVEVLNNGQLTGETAEVNDSGEFTVQTKLNEGENNIKVVSLYEGHVAAVSNEIIVTVDTEAPVLNITSPEDGLETNEDTVSVEGQVIEENLEFLEVNGSAVTPDTDGHFQTAVELTEGLNHIEVTAGDIVGNVVTEEVLVTLTIADPEIDNVQPDTDQYVRPGDTVTVSFTSDTEDGEASFSVKLPALSSDTGDHAMEETEPGVYEGTWAVPTNTDLEGALIEVNLTDEFGNTVVETAEGKLYISSDQIDRIEGDDRYDTAIEISREGWSESDTVILARGDEFADALAGVPLAHKLDVPILLTLQDRLSKNGMAEIERLGAENVIVLGGDEAIEDSVIDELESAGLDVRRIAGDARFETAALIAAEVSPDGASEVAVANGMDFPDALSVASHAAKEGMPILLTMADRLPVDTEAALGDLGATDSIVVGEELVVADEVVSQLPNPLRLGGDDRYETNIALAEHFGVESNHLYVATGHLYADALTGAVLAAESDSAIVLVHHAVPASVENYINSNDVVRLTIFGGDVAVDLEIEHELERLLP